MFADIVLAFYALLTVTVLAFNSAIAQDIARRMHRPRLNRLINERETAWLRDTRLYRDDGRNRIDVG